GLYWLEGTVRCTSNSRRSAPALSSLGDWASTRSLACQQECDLTECSGKKGLAANHRKAAALSPMALDCSPGLPGRRSGERKKRAAYGRNANNGDGFVYIRSVAGHSGHKHRKTAPTVLAPQRPA